jgi:mono/diheme cytochrome c family protein
MAATDQPYRNQQILDVVFGVSCVLLLASTVWMFVQDYNRDFKSVQRTFRDVESTLAERDMVDKLPHPDVVKEKRLDLRDARRELARAQREVAGKDRRIKAKRERADEKYRGIKADVDANRSYLDIAVDNKNKYPPDTYGHRSAKAREEELRKKLDKLNQDLTKAKDDLDAIETEYRDKVRSRLEDPEKAVAGAEDELKKTAGAFERFGKLAAQKRWGPGDTFRALPILDAFESPTKVKQIWLPELTIDYSFKEVPRFDRCTSCHLGIDRAAFSRDALTKLGDDEESRRLTGKVAQAQEILEKRNPKDLGFDPSDLPGERQGHLGWIVLILALSSIVAAGSLGVLERSTRVGVRVLTAGLALTLVTGGAIAAFAPKKPVVKAIKLKEGEVAQYAAHPRLDLFVDNNSPHAMEKFGCTICHAGQGSATEFVLASHTPEGSSQEERWKEAHDWHSIHHWDYPMLSKRFVESSCVKCHHQMTDLIRHGSKEEAPKLLRGYNLVKENGCFGCHEIAGLKAGKPIGPDLRLESAPALEYLTAGEQERARSDPANPPGTMRKVGPSLRRLAEKTDETWTRKWVHAPRDFRPDTKMPHFYSLSTNHPDVLPEAQKSFPNTEVFAIAHYLLHESKDHLDGKDFYRQMLLQGKQNVFALQAALAKTGLPDKELKELYDVSRRLADLALLSSPMSGKAINSSAHRQRHLQERINELQKRLSEQKARGVSEGDQKATQTEIANAAGELAKEAADLVKEAKPAPLSPSHLIAEDGAVVALPKKEGDAANGRRLFTERGCLACHAHEGTTKTGGLAVAGEANFGPELSRIAAKLRPATDKAAARLWLVQWLLNPNVHHPRTRMPITHLKVEDANDVAAWLLSQKVTDWQGPEVKEPTLAEIKSLARVYLAKAPGVTHTDLEKFLPEAGDELPGIPKDRLEPLARDAEERRLEEGQLSREALLWYVGKKAIGRQGCYACHDIPGFETAKPIGTGLNEWGKKDPERLAFEDAESFARLHYNIVPSRTTRGEVEAKIARLEAKPETDRTDADDKELKRLKRQVQVQDRIHELEEKAETKDGLSRQERKELEEIHLLKFFEPHKGIDENGKERLKQPVEEVFFKALEHPHQSREGFLHQKLLDPRSYDYNRERPWDDRLRMPEFKFARSRKKATETDAQYRVRLEKDEAEAREAVMTFILGLVAEPIPSKYLHTPQAEKKAEVLGRQVLEKYNCGGCHQVRPGVYEFEATRENLKLVTQAYQAAAGDNDVNFKEDYFHPAHSAWVGSPSASNRLAAVGYFDPAGRAKNDEEGFTGLDTIRLTDALRFTGAAFSPRDSLLPAMELSQLARLAGVALDLPAGSELRLARGRYTEHHPYGGTFTDLMVPYLMRKNPTLFDPKDPGKSRAVLPPPLVREGERVQPDWLYKFLLNPGVVRPEGYMLLRMPKFNMSPEESRALVNYFAAVSRVTNPGSGVTYPYVNIEQRDREYWRRVTAEYFARVKARGDKEVDSRANEMRHLWEERAKKELKEAESALPGLKKAQADAKEKKAPDLKERTKAVTDAQARIEDLKSQLKKKSFPDQRGRWEANDIYARDAFKLLTNKDLCLKCHDVGGILTEGPQGPNLALAPERLRPEWSEQWIGHPKRMFPYQPVMPQNFPNEPDPVKWKFQETFVGSPLQQTRAVRDIIMDLPRLNDLLANPPTPPTTPPAAGGGNK